MNYSKFFSQPKYDYYRGTFDDLAITNIPLPTWQDIIQTLTKERNQIARLNYSDIQRLSAYSQPDIQQAHIPQ